VRCRTRDAYMYAIDPLLFPGQGIYCLLVQAQALWPTEGE
jgi:hypothetical protein